MKKVIILLFAIAMLTAGPAAAGSLSISSTGSDGTKTTVVKKTYSEDYYQKQKKQQKVQRNTTTGSTGTTDRQAQIRGQQEAESRQRFEEVKSKWESINTQMDDVYEQFQKDADKMK